MPVALKASSCRSVLKSTSLSIILGKSSPFIDKLHGANQGNCLFSRNILFFSIRTFPEHGPRLAVLVIYSQNLCDIVNSQVFVAPETLSDSGNYLVSVEHSLFSQLELFQKKIRDVALFLYCQLFIFSLYLGMRTLRRYA